MSVEKVQAFFEKAAEDTDLQKKLKALGEREEALYADLVAIATKAGFQFTTADARKARESAARTLSAQELDAVAGGAGQGTVNLQRICVLLWPNV
jgi:predicted ribosomally synthesized peptide with nif11-like leader